MAKSLQEREEAKQVRELRKQLIKTRRENAQLRKRIHSLEGVLIEAEEDAIELESFKFSKKSKIVDENKIKCPKCHSFDTKEIELRGMLYYNCAACGSRGKL